MIIDFHSHLVPAHWADRLGLPPFFTDVEAFFATKERQGITTTVISHAMINRAGSSIDQRELPWIQEFNEFAAGLVDSNPGRVLALTSANPMGGHPMLSELEQAVASGRFRGVTVHSSVDGQYLDAPAAGEFWDCVEELGVPVFIHAPGFPGGHEDLDLRLTEFAARYHDVGLGVAALIMSGVLEWHPGVRIVAGSAGGGLAMLIGRLDVGYQFAPPRDRPVGGPPPPNQMLDRPSDYLRQVYVDSCTFDRNALRFTVEMLGADHIVFGTDYPPVRVPDAYGVDSVRNLRVADVEREHILYRNAAELLGLQSGGTGVDSR